MDEYFGIRVAGWHEAFPEGDFPKYWHPECLPDQSEVENPVFPVFEEGEYEWQPECDHCHKPILVNLSDRYMENIGLVAVRF